MRGEKHMGMDYGMAPMAPKPKKKKMMGMKTKKKKMTGGKREPGYVR